MIINCALILLFFADSDIHSMCIWTRLQLGGNGNKPAARKVVCIQPAASGRHCNRGGWPRRLHSGVRTRQRPWSIPPPSLDRGMFRNHTELLEQLHRCAVCNNPCKWKFDEEKSQQNGFDPTFWHCLLRLGKKAQQKLLTPAIEEECNRYDMSAAPSWFWLAG